MDKKLAGGISEHQEQLALRWNLLDNECDPCTVVTRRMEVVYVNAAAKFLVTSGWFGCRCWEVFPVREDNCVARCSAVRAVSNADDIVYCEETIYAAGGAPVPLGVAVIPIRTAGGDGERAILLLRSKSSSLSDDLFRRETLNRARKLRALYD